MLELTSLDLDEIASARSVIGRGCGFDRRRSLTSGLVRAVLVIVVGVLGENLGQMLLVENQHLIEHLTAERADHALADRVRLRSLRRSP